MTNAQKQEPKLEEREATDLGSRASGESRAEGWGGKDWPYKTPKRAKAVHASSAVGDKATLGPVPGEPQARDQETGPRTAGGPETLEHRWPRLAFHEILQARVLEWVAFPSSRGSSQPRIKRGSPALYQLSYQESFTKLRYGVLRKFKTQLSGRIDLPISKQSEQK